MMLYCNKDYLQVTKGIFIMNAINDKNKVVIGIDVGGSTTKIVGFRRDENGSETLIAPLFVQATDPITSIYGAFGRFTMENNLSLSDVDKVMMTGGGSSFRSQPIYTLPCNNVSEFECIGLGGLYLGSGLCLVLLIQLCKHNWVLCLYLVNLLLVAAKVIKELVLQYKDQPSDDQKLGGIRHFLRKGQNFPILGLLMAIPLLGIALAVLTLFGQEPDSIIQAWTQTSDWTLSQQVAPPNLPRDMHYLCTVAAQGHQPLVKPLRMGKRHGHWVLVNRQLAVSNAFEELIQERTPRLHRIIRSIYDRYGYPIANHIRSPLAADMVWLIMKPAEWFFLSVLYFCDCKPENRIAVQYPHKELPSIDH